MIQGMQGTSRESLRQLREELQTRGADRESGAVTGELLSVAALLGRELSLRGALTDPGVPPDSRAGTVDTLFGSRLGEGALSVVRDAARLRWSRPRDLADALEVLGAQTAFTAAERDDTLDSVEDELFRFGRTVAAQSALRGALEDPAASADAKIALLRDLLGAKVSPTTLVLLEHVVRSPRGRRVTEAIDGLVTQAAERNQQIVAEVRVPVALAADQERRLVDALGRIYGRQVQLQVAVDPQLLGGAVVTVGDEIIDGSVVYKLDSARRRLTS